jgi:hypothetical protein
VPLSAFDLTKEGLMQEARSRLSWVARSVAVASALVLTAAIAGPARAEHNDAHFIEKFVSAVNGQPVTDPNLGAGSEFIEVAPGDLVQFRIRMTNQDVDNVSIRDVYKFNDFDFVSSEAGQCGSPTQPSNEDNEIECSVDVDQTDADFLLTFRVMTDAPEGEGCKTITNTAHVEVGSGGDQASDVAQVRVCADEASLGTSPSPSPDGGAAAGGGGAPAATTLPDAAVTAPTSGNAPWLAIASLGVLFAAASVRVLLAARR